MTSDCYNSMCKQFTILSLCIPVFFFQQWIKLKVRMESLILEWQPI